MRWAAFGIACLLFGVGVFVVVGDFIYTEPTWHRVLGDVVRAAIFGLAAVYIVLKLDKR